MNNYKNKETWEKLRICRTILEDNKTWVTNYEETGGCYGDMTHEDYRDFKDNIVNLENEIEELKKEM